MTGHENKSELISDYGSINLTLGQKMPDTSYYMGVSESAGTDFFLFIESPGKNKTADVVTFNEGTELLQNKYKNNEVFHGRKFSEFQLAKDIISSYKNNTADSGIRRLTIKELEQSIEVIQKIPELHELALEVCSNSYRVQSAAPLGVHLVWFQRHSSNHNGCVNYCTASVLVGYSVSPSPQL